MQRRKSRLRRSRCPLTSISSSTCSLLSGKLVAGSGRSVAARPEKSAFPYGPTVPLGSGWIPLCSSGTGLRNPYELTTCATVCRTPGVRAIVEHPFHVVNDLSGYRKVGDRGLAKNEVRIKAHAALADLYIARRRWLAQGARASAAWAMPGKWSPNAIKRPRMRRRGDHSDTRRDGARGRVRRSAIPLLATHAYSSSCWVSCSRRVTGGIDSAARTSSVFTAWAPVDPWCSRP